MALQTPQTHTPEHAPVPQPEAAAIEAANQTPVTAVETIGQPRNRNTGRIAGAIGAAALVVGGGVAMLRGGGGETDSIIFMDDTAESFAPGAAEPHEFEGTEQGAEVDNREAVVSDKPVTLEGEPKPTNAEVEVAGVMLPTYEDFNQNGQINRIFADILETSLENSSRDTFVEALSGSSETEATLPFFYDKFKQFEGQDIHIAVSVSETDSAGNDIRPDMVKERVGGSGEQIAEDGSLVTALRFEVTAEGSNEVLANEWIIMASAYDTEANQQPSITANWKVVSANNFVE